MIVCGLQASGMAPARAAKMRFMLHRQGDLIERIVLALIVRQGLLQQSPDEGTASSRRHPALEPTRQFFRQADNKLLECR